jgi:hypothetical protein
MQNTFMVTNLPRSCGGASSARYSGTTKLAVPTAMPTTARPRTMAGTVPLADWIRAPRANSASAHRMTRRRPREGWSASSEEKGEMRRARREVEEVMMDLSSAVRGREESEVPRETRVPEITPVSSVGV